jgi:hypothetical protein
MILVRLVESIEEFAGLEESWNNVLRHSKADTIFLTHQWLYSWWNAFANNARLHVLLCYEIDGDNNIKKLIGIFPGYVRRDKWQPLTRCLRLLGSEIVTSDFLDVISLSGREQTVFDAILTHVNNESSAHLLELTDIKEDSPFIDMLETAEEVNGWRTRQWSADKLCPVIDLPSEWDKFLTGLTRSVRKNFQYYSRRLQAQGAEVEIVQNPNEIAEAMVDFRRLHNSRRSQKKQEGIFATREQNRFYDEVLQRLATAGWLELVFLKIEGMRIAVVCQFDYGDAAYYYQTGYDIAWERHSVGFVLNGLLIERAISMGKTYYEFLRGEEDYKYRLGATRNRCLRDVYLANGTMLGELYLTRKKLIRGCRRIAKQLLRLSPHSKFLPQENIR